MAPGFAGNRAVDAPVLARLLDFVHVHIPHHFSAFVPIRRHPRKGRGFSARRNLHGLLGDGTDRLTLCGDGHFAQRAIPAEGKAEDLEGTWDYSPSDGVLELKGRLDLSDSPPELQKDDAILGPMLEVPKNRTDIEIGDEGTYQAEDSVHVGCGLRILSSLLAISCSASPTGCLFSTGEPGRGGLQWPRPQALALTPTRALL